MAKERVHQVHQQRNKGDIFLKKFELVDRIIIRRPRLKPVKNSLCFLNNFDEIGFTVRDLRKYFNNKCMDIYRYNGVIRSNSKVCPWCREKQISHDELLRHIQRYHNKCPSNLWEYRMQLDLYRLLLSYVRNGNYDALSFLVQSTCQLCICPEVKGREGKCAIPESSRNKPRSFRNLGFTCEGFGKKDFNHVHTCIVYQRRSVKA